ncbi:MAG: hypothetical protein MMC23_003296 [Stictis urceolatum]|nr:hypothetical protein [Stictis urceolata]
MSKVPPVSILGNWTGSVVPGPSIGPNAKDYSKAMLVLCIVAIISVAAIRIFRKFRGQHNFGLDNGILLAAITFALLSALLDLINRKLLYSVVDRSIHVGRMQNMTRSWIPKVMKYCVVSSCFAWLSIFCAKLSCMAFFNKPTIRSFSVRRWYLLATVLVLVAAPFCIFSPLFICPSYEVPEHYEMGSGGRCTDDQIIGRAFAIVAVWTALDLFTDFLVFSIPLALLRCIENKPRHWLAAGSMIGFALVKVTVPILRLKLAFMPSTQFADPILIIFLNAVEASVSVSMVSATCVTSIWYESPEHGIYISTGMNWLAQHQSSSTSQSWVSDSHSEEQVQARCVSERSITVERMDITDDPEQGM